MKKTLHSDQMRAALDGLSPMIRLSFPDNLRVALLEQAAALDVARYRLDCQEEVIDSLRVQLAELSNQIKEKP